MSLDAKNITGQTWDFPASASTTNKSSSIVVGSQNELVGIRWPALEALSAKIKLETTEDALAVGDTAATWEVLTDKAGDDVVLVGAYTAKGRMAFDPSSVALSPFRCRLAVYKADGTTAVNQDEQVVVPKFRQF